MKNLPMIDRIGFVIMVAFWALILTKATLDGEKNSKCLKAGGFPQYTNAGLECRPQKPFDHPYRKEKP